MISLSAPPCRQYQSDDEQVLAGQSIVNRIELVKPGAPKGIVEAKNVR